MRGDGEGQGRAGRLSRLSDEEAKLGTGAPTLVGADVVLGVPSAHGRQERGRVMGGAAGSLWREEKA